MWMQVSSILLGQPKNITVKRKQTTVRFQALKREDAQKLATQNASDREAQELNWFKSCLGDYQITPDKLVAHLFKPDTTPSKLALVRAEILKRSNQDKDNQTWALLHELRVQLTKPETRQQFSKQLTLLLQGLIQNGVKLASNTQQHVNHRDYHEPGVWEIPMYEYEYSTNSRYAKFPQDYQKPVFSPDLEQQYLKVIVPLSNNARFLVGVLNHELLKTTKKMSPLIQLAQTRLVDLATQRTKQVGYDIDDGTGTDGPHYVFGGYRDHSKAMTKHILDLLEKMPALAPDELVKPLMNFIAG
jgi:hypothetical protein